MERTAQGKDFELICNGKNGNLKGDHLAVSVWHL